MELIRELVNNDYDADATEIRVSISKDRIEVVMLMNINGRFFNLKEMFDKLNHEYFGGTLLIKITWGKSVRNGRRYIRFGSYTEKDNIIRIHPSLDREDIPSYFIESIVYHEMLHKIVGARIVNGRRRIHTPEFKNMDRRFKHYKEAREWEKSNIRRLLKHYG